VPWFSWNSQILEAERIHKQKESISQATQGGHIIIEVLLRKIG